MTEQSLAEWLARLEALHPREIELGLERVAAVARRLQLLPVSVPVVTVAGTNGKGSVVGALEALLTHKGIRTGVYTSPHLLRFNERIRIGGCEADDAGIVSALQAIDVARGDISLTYFEFATLAGLLLFQREAVDVVVLEVGLGGRLDAVNIVDPNVAVITSIALDHQDWLGDSLDAIAREKAGILRPDIPAVIACSEVPAGLAEAVMASGASAYWLGEAFGVEPAMQEWDGWVSGTEGTRRRLPLSQNPALLAQNLYAALQVLECLGYPVSDVEAQAILPALQVPGRRQAMIVGGVELVLDVAHNPAAVARLVEFLQQRPCGQKTIAVFSAMADKDIPSMLQLMRGEVDGWFLADQPGNARAATAAGIAAQLRAAGEGMISVSRNLRQALARARSVAAAGDRLLVFGSFHTVAAAMSWLAREREKA
ncbi:bifunctional tetrahydrofolate synthase/dihydrofolate synthase [Haliea sp.]|uniref:bifunctional tetrahydrofolate synthase/dihydrofolate synthase n=1 Tax=Haliea sp. TaxID=1932666 RepID=UPI0025C13A51|nr:bifunctional tetrahydrofolate synthase/dihydrofolate synthase [Haliea sp.]|tara:strand:- start:29799 stop:31079 length:1281 start_codon:yes stop_codon:yes gene_type:complete